MSKKKSDWLRLEKSRNRRLWLETAIKAGGVLVGAATVINSSPELKLKYETFKYETKKKVDGLVSKFKKS